MKKKITHRIPYESWINSHLSIARYAGGCFVNGKEYVFDPDCVYDENGNGKPDLVTYDDVHPVTQEVTLWLEGRVHHNGTKKKTIRKRNEKET